MRPVKLTIPGRYWDSQIYEGRLYLFTIDGSILTINWDYLISSISISAELKLARECAFRRSDYLYGSNWDLVFSDADIKSLMVDKFSRLSGTDIQIDASELADSLVGEQDNAFPFPHADSTIYRRTLYVTGLTGVWGASCNKKTTKPVSTKETKKWDGPGVAIAAGYDHLSVAAGPEGLWDIPTTDTFTPQPSASQLSTDECDTCEHMYQDVVCSAYDGQTFIAEYATAETEIRAWRGPVSRTRSFSRIQQTQYLFSGGGYTWGLRDKLFNFNQSTVSIVRYSPFRGERFTDVDKVRIAGWKGSLVGAGAAPFGTVLGFDNALVVLCSDGSTETISGEPVSWRTFPSSKHYQNHLHVISDDRLTVYSYNQDYFVDQKNKGFGVRPLYDRRRGVI
jgi:hypothetical protein